MKKTNYSEKLKTCEVKRELFLQCICQKRAESVEIRTLTGGHRANDATRAYFIDSARLLLPPPLPSSPQAVEDGGGKEEGYISPTRHPSICLAVGWLQKEKRGRERTKRTGRGGGGGGGCKDGGRTTKRNEDGGCRLEKTEARKRRRRM